MAIRNLKAPMNAGTGQLRLWRTALLLHSRRTGAFWPIQAVRRLWHRKRG